jgi:hypothetical protein
VRERQPVYSGIKSKEAEMNAHLAEELLNELGSSLEALEAQNAALLQFLKDKGIVADEQLAPYINQAGKASNVRWRAARVRLERIFASATKEEEEKAEVKKKKTEEKKTEEEKTEKNEDQLPKEQAIPDQQKRTNQQPENTTKEIKSKDEAASAEKTSAEKEGRVETKPETAQEEGQGNKASPAKAEDNAA